MAKHVDGFVSGDGVLLAIRDYGGAGSPAILLLHGSGRSLADWTPMASDLTQHHRVVAMDIRGHGLSEAGHWDLRALMADIEAVLNHYGMPSAALAGTSMGGVLAHLFAAAHPDTTAVINFDGFSLRPDEHVGLSPAVVAERQARALAEYKWSRASFSADELNEEVEAWSERYHQPRGLIEVGFQRVFRQDQDKKFYHREEEITGNGIMHLYHVHLSTISLFETIRSLKCRSLVFRSNDPLLPEDLPEWRRELWDAYFAGVHQQLSWLEQTAHVSVRRTKASHFMILEESRQLSRQVRQFLSA